MKNAKKLTLTIIVAIIMSQMIMSVSYATTATVITETLRLRKAPTTDSNILRNLDAGDKVEVLEKEGDWYKISFDGKEGYIAAEYVKIDGEGLSTTDKKQENDKKEDVKVEEEPKVETNANTDNTVKDDNENSEVKVKANTDIYILPVLISSPIETIKDETTINVIETVNNWTNIEVNGTTGWVLNKYIENLDKANKDTSVNVNTTPTEKEPEEVKTTKGYVNVSSANVRAEASKDAKVVKTLVLNNKVEIIEKDGDWYKIKNGDGVAYIFASLVSDEKVKVTDRSSSNRTDTTKSSTTTSKKTTNETASKKSAELVSSKTGDSVAKYAKQFVGHDYVYGGSGTKVFDCSGLTMYVFKQYGIKLPHNAATQSNYGKYVSKKNLVPGDLLIFNDYANKSIGHCGIYLGDGKFVHAANSKRGVVIDTITSGYYDARFVEGRRLI